MRVYTCVYAYVYVYIYICMHVYVYICMYVYTYICMYILMCIYVYAYVYVCVYIYVCIFVFIYIYICLYIACMCSLMYLALGNEDGVVQLVYERAYCLVWGVIFDRRKDKGVVCVFSIFNAGASVCGCVCVYTHPHTHCTDRVLGCEPRSRDETPGGPKESRWTKSRHTCIRTRVQSAHVCICAKRQDEILDSLLSPFDMSFLLRKVEDVTRISKPQSFTSVRIKDCTLRVPNKTTTLFLSE